MKKRKKKTRKDSLMSLAQRQSWQNPEIRRKRMEGIQKPETKLKHKEGLKRAFKTTNMIEGLKKGWEERKKKFGGKPLIEVVNLCKCGCGAEIRVRTTKPETVPIYKKGHHMKGRKHTEEAKMKISKANKGKKHPWCAGDKNPMSSIGLKKSWKQKTREEKEERFSKILKAVRKRPTCYEQRLIELISANNLPIEYTGDGSLWINRKNPDFVTKDRKKVIEVYYSYWKDNDYEEKRRSAFQKDGVDVLFLNEDSLKQGDAFLLNRIIDFVEV